MKNISIIKSVLIILVIGISLFIDISAFSLPLYTARSGRVCDNCHASPYKTDKQDEWPNPRLASRKCNVSCQTCHINPSGAGLRNVVGRFYARNTLPMFNPIQRPYHDKDRTFANLFSSSNKDDKKGKTTAGNKDEYKFAENKNPKKDIQEHHKPHFFYGYDTFAWGAPFNADTLESQSEYAFARERYGHLNADPIFMIGADLKPTFLWKKSRKSVFPMQAEIGGAFHPIEHLTISATGAVQGRRTGYADSTSIKLQNAFVMLHELPLMTFVQAGLFLPSYGVFHDDHKAPGRQYLELDQSVLKNTVLGVQVGFTANYPYLTLALFKNRTERDDYIHTGWGFTATAGWRDLGWGAGISAMHKKRDLLDGGNLSAVGINGYFNVGRYDLDVPLVFQTEFNFGRKPDTGSNDRSFISTLLQVDYLLVNGVNLKVAHSYWIDGLSTNVDKYQLITTAINYTIIYGVKLNMEFRQTIPSQRNYSALFMMFAHFYI